MRVCWFCGISFPTDQFCSDYCRIHWRLGRMGYQINRQMGQWGIVDILTESK